MRASASHLRRLAWHGRLHSPADVAGNDGPVRLALRLRGGGGRAWARRQATQRSALAVSGCMSAGGLAGSLFLSSLAARAAATTHLHRVRSLHRWHFRCRAQALASPATGTPAGERLRFQTRRRAHRGERRVASGAVAAAVGRSKVAHPLAVAVAAAAAPRRVGAGRGRGRDHGRRSHSSRLEHGAAQRPRATGQSTERRAQRCADKTRAA